MGYFRGLFFKSPTDAQMHEIYIYIYIFLQSFNSNCNSNSKKKVKGEVKKGFTVHSHASPGLLVHNRQHHRPSNMTCVNNGSDVNVSKYSEARTQT